MKIFGITRKLVVYLLSKGFTFSFSDVDSGPVTQDDLDEATTFNEPFSEAVVDDDDRDMVSVTIDIDTPSDPGDAVNLLAAVEKTVSQALNSASKTVLSSLDHSPLAFNWMSEGCQVVLACHGGVRLEIFEKYDRVHKDM